MIAAFYRIGQAAAKNSHHLELAVYDGSALMLASNFRYTSEDVDIAELPYPWPAWLNQVIEDIARHNNWSADWLNDAVTFHLSSQATQADDHVLVGTFPRSSEQGGLKVYVPSHQYMLALKLKAIRVMDPAKGPQEAKDIVNLVKVLKIETSEAAVEIMAQYFPKSAQDPTKHLFLLRQIWNAESVNAPQYPGRDW